MRKMNHGWRECNNNQIHFDHYGFNIPRILCQLSDYIDLITGKRKKIKLNPMAESCICDDTAKNFEIETKIEESNRHSRNDAHNNKNKDNESTCANTKIKLKTESKQSKIKGQKEIAIEKEKDNDAKIQNVNMESNDDAESKFL